MIKIVESVSGKAPPQQVYNQEEKLESHSEDVYRKDAAKMVQFIE